MPVPNLAATAIAVLDWRTRNSAVRTIDTAVALERLKDSGTAFTVVKPLTGISRHGLAFDVMAFWASKNRS